MATYITKGAGDAGLAILIGLLVGLVATSLLPVQTRTQPASASQTAEFDHSTCQYPTRWSNPVDGCDNTDPAVPECTKAWTTQEAEQTCIAQFVKQNEPASQAPANPPQSSTPPTNTCGGK